MSYTRLSSGSFNQGGAALVVALVLLAAISIIGLSNMQSTNMNIKLAKSTMDRESSFHIVESALLSVEKDIISGNMKDRAGKDIALTSDSLKQDPANKACGGTSTVPPCFSSNCTGGFCFQGVYEKGQDEAECLTRTPGVALEDFAARADTWSNTAKHNQITIDKGNVTHNVKYIVEFLCFVDQDYDPTDPNSVLDFPPSESTVNLGNNLNLNGGMPIFRVTARVEKGAGTIPVMLQYTFPNPVIK